jgi:hypothetical protein
MFRAPHVTATISEAGEFPPEATLPTLSSDYETAPFTPDFWNAQPGRSTQREAASFTAGEIAEAAMSDGAVSATDTVDGGGAPRYLAALFIWPGHDYHWYRLHADGSWVTSLVPNWQRRAIVRACGFATLVFAVVGTMQISAGFSHTEELQRKIVWFSRANRLQATTAPRNDRSRCDKAGVYRVSATSIGSR